MEFFAAFLQPNQPPSHCGPRTGRWHRRSADFQSAVSRIYSAGLIECAGVPRRSADYKSTIRRLKICATPSANRPVVPSFEIRLPPCVWPEAVRKSFLQTPSSQPSSQPCRACQLFRTDATKAATKVTTTALESHLLAKRFARALGAHFAKCGSLLPNGCGVRACPRLSRQVFHRELPRLAIRRPREFARFRVAQNLLRVGIKLHGTSQLMKIREGNGLSTFQ